MKTTSRFMLMSAVVLMTLVMSAVWTMPAFADDGVTPPTDPTTEEVTPVEPLGDLPPAEEVSAPVESLPVEEIAPVAETSLPELLDQLPEGTDVIVTDSAGEAIPLVSEEAAQAVITHDPVWCPVGATPGVSTTCSKSYASLDLLVNEFSTTGQLTNAAALTFSPTGNGVIWIEAGADGSALSPIIIDGDNLNFGAIVNSSLTLQGGWSGLNNAIVNAATPSLFDQQISIINWTGAVTVKNITIENATIDTVFNEYALTVTTEGNITAEGVTVTGSMNNDATHTLSGTLLDNTSSTGSSTVTVNNGIFNANEGDGLAINSDGIVTTNNLIANGNTAGTGVHINNTTNGSLLPDKAVIMKGIKQFNDNSQNGLKIDSKGLITLGNINANNNGAAGVSIDNSTSATNQGVTISGTNYFMGNTVDGLNVLSHGVITVSGLNALHNTGSGVILDNCQDNGLGGCFAPAKNVMLTGVNNFSWNTDFGLKVFSFGMITVNNITANHNANESGVLLDNTRSMTGVAGVSVLGTNYFSNNGNAADISDTGITVLSHGVIIANNITAIYNQGIGAYLDNCGNTGVPTTICSSVTVAKSVSLTGINVFNGNNLGLKIYSFGAIVMYNVTANSNNNNGGAQGALIHNDTTNSTAVESVGTITLNGYGIFNFNSTSSGMDASSHSNMILNNVTANSNGDLGLYLSASRTTGAASVTLRGFNTFNDNFHTGIEVAADGAISINSLTASSNGTLAGGGNGAYLINKTSTLPAIVTLSGSVNVNNNAELGLFIDTRGAVTLTSVTANNNGNCAVAPCYDGVHIINTTGNSLTPQNVTLNGINTFTNNGLNGLYVETYGLITLSNVTSNLNKASGLYLDNHLATMSATLLPRGVTILGYIRVNDNVNEGLYIDTHGVVSLTNIYANNNGSATGKDGVYIKNNYGNAAVVTGAYSQNVTISGINTFTQNGLNGLYVLSYGVISATNINASFNGADGASLDNCKTGCPFASTGKNITLTGKSIFDMNEHDGLFYSASGLASLSNVSADFNGGLLGGYVGKGIWGVSTGTLTLVCVHTYGNDGAGYTLTGSTIIIKNLQSFGDNANGTDPNAITGTKTYMATICP